MSKICNYVFKRKDRPFNHYKSIFKGWSIELNKNWEGIMYLVKNVLDSIRKEVAISSSLSHSRKIEERCLIFIENEYGNVPEGISLNVVEDMLREKVDRDIEEKVLNSIKIQG